ncbi:unnamed protein product [Kuraishia capsulata CBS 1993]|uniref:RRM domain-containing protein n=1 Tax=Kuraishia capsulata CBS 1993 TaxID=1382522 RepID=W6MU25_9ASCO|nr:uncharacterized protein KUCA_T00004817001 [Kuraishia capsulata CBS 1993]CDK28832.1 unnamed protein product [Kuraishia capsulata CBS 1993]
MSDPIEILEGGQESQEVQKLTKKQRKALEFKAKTSEKSQKELEKIQKHEEELKAQEEANKPKKRKTRRGKKGRGSVSKEGPRFILFVGNLPYGVTQTELVSHFKTSSPDNIRMRPEKGIAFLEFSNENTDIQTKINVALKQHHTLLKGRKINVELTAGGGGNSKDRLEKIKGKNEKLFEERRSRILEGEHKTREKRVVPGDDAKSSVTSGGMHPDRAKLMK